MGRTRTLTLRRRRVHVHDPRGRDHHIRSRGRHPSRSPRSRLPSVLSVGASPCTSPGLGSRGRRVKIGRGRVRRRPGRRWGWVGAVVGLGVLDDRGCVCVGAVLLLLGVRRRWGRRGFGLFGHRW